MFKSDKQRKAAFANMNRFSVASAVIDLFPGGNDAPTTVGISAEGAEQEMEQWRQMYSGSRFSEQEVGAEESSGDVQSEPIEIDTSGDKMQEDMNQTVHDMRFEQYMEEKDDEPIIVEQPEVDYDVVGTSETSGVFTGSDGDVYYTDTEVGSGENMGFGTSYESEFDVPQDEPVSTRSPELEAFASGGRRGAIEGSAEIGSVRGKAQKVYEHREPVDVMMERSGVLAEEGARTEAAAIEGAFAGRESGFKRAGRGLIDAAEKDFVGFAVGLGHAPRTAGKKIVSATKDIAGAAGKAAIPAAARGAEAFGTIAGGAVAGGLREFGDIIEAPQREYHIPPGYQKVYDYSSGKYKTVPVQRQPIAPFVPQIGQGQVAGVVVPPADFVAGQEMLQGGFWGGLSGKQAEDAFLERSKKSGGSGFRTSSYIPTRGVSRTAASAIRQKSELDRMRAALGQSNPRVQRQQAALQSKVGYLDRKTLPGTPQDVMMRSARLRSI